MLASVKVPGSGARTVRGEMEDWREEREVGLVGRMKSSSSSESTTQELMIGEREGERREREKERREREEKVKRVGME